MTFLRRAWALVAAAMLVASLAAVAVTGPVIGADKQCPNDQWTWASYLSGQPLGYWPQDKNLDGTICMKLVPGKGNQGEVDGVVFIDNRHYAPPT